MPTAVIFGINPGFSLDIREYICIQKQYFFSKLPHRRMFEIEFFVQNEQGE